MFKILTMLFSFCREIIFGKNGESDHDTLTISARKWLILITIISSFMLNYVMVRKIYQLGMSHVELSKTVKELKDAKDALDDEVVKTKLLEDYLKLCFRNSTKLTEKLKK